MPKKPPVAQFHLRLDAAVLARVKKAATREQVSLNAYLTRLLASLFPAPPSSESRT